MSRWKIKRRVKAGRKSREHQASQDGPIAATITPVALADMPALQRYFKAHELLPTGYIFDPRQDRYQRIVALAVKQLKDTTARKRELTRAIVILGHSPTPSAIEALERMSEARHSLSDMARMALDECLTLVADPDLPDSQATRGVN